MRVAVVVLVLAVGLWFAHPWTVRPIADPVPASGAVADPAAFADAIWGPKLVPAIVARAEDARVVLNALTASRDEAHRRYGRADGSGSWFVAIRASGRVLSVDRRSVNGLARIDIAPFDGRPDLAVQIGPVIRGTSLRDTTELVAFTDFVNQLQFADVANALNARSMSMVIAPVADRLAPGAHVSLVGTANDGSADGTGDPLSGVVPVQLTIDGGTRE